MSQRLSSVIQNWLSKQPDAQLPAAIALSLVATAWVIGAKLYAEPELLISLPVAAIALGAFVGILLAIGGIGWIVLQMLRLILLWRAHEEEPGELTKTQWVWVSAVVIFLGIPEFWHAFAWWQEHALEKIYGERELVDQVKGLLDRNLRSILGFAFAAFVLGMIFSKVYKTFGERSRRALTLLRNLLDHRDWRLPIVVFVMMVAVGGVCLTYPDHLEGWFEVISVGFIASVIWLILPILRPNLVWLVFGAACMGPGAIVTGHLIHNPGISQMLASVAWGAWLCSIDFVHRRYWRFIYWPGVAALLGYVVSIA
jgi:hypothetical protein